MGSLTILLVLPLVSLLAVLLVPEERRGLMQRLVLLTTLLQLGWLLGSILPEFRSGQAAFMDFRLVERWQWIRLDLGHGGLLNIDYHLAMDGISLVLVLLALLVLPVVAYKSFGVEKRAKAYWSLFLLLNLSMIGCFLALDFFLFYLFYEFMLLPMFFLIGMWGGARREYAAIKFFLYTLFGSVFMLLVMVGLAFSFTDPGLTAALGRPVYTFNMLHMMPDLSGYFPNMVPGSVFSHGTDLLGMDARTLAFFILLIGFAIKVPSVPLHTWLPDAHVEASTPISVVLAAVLLKVGGYGILRICYGLFPEAGVSHSMFVAILGMVSLLYGGLVAMSQKDLKAMIAYSSISHMGFVLLGIACLDAAGMNGAVLQMFNHGVVSAALFLIAGVVSDRVHDRRIANFTGLWSRMPRYAVFVLITFFASMGLPGLNSFVSEMLVLLGSFKATPGAMPAWIPLVSVLGIVFSAVYFLRTFRQMFFGEFSYVGTGDGGALTDLKSSETVLFVPLTVLMLLLGILPGLVLGLVETAVSGYSQLLGNF
jgi:NADH-quinone oxidoreductase subunit M